MTAFKNFNNRNRWNRSSLLRKNLVDLFSQSTLKRNRCQQTNRMAHLLGYFIVMILCATQAIFAEKESNILKLSNSQKTVSISMQTPNFNTTEEKSETKKRTSLVGFSKNNPELDWKNYLKMFVGKEEEHRDLDVDFMKEKLERTANSIQWLADLYDPLRWARVPGKLQDECKKDMEKFLNALKAGKLWAAKSKSFID